MSKIKQKYRQGDYILVFKKLCVFDSYSSDGQSAIVCLLEDPEIDFFNNKIDLKTFTVAITEIEPYDR